MKNYKIRVSAFLKVILRTFWTLSGAPNSDSLVLFFKKRRLDTSLSNKKGKSENILTVRSG